MRIRRQIHEDRLHCKPRSSLELQSLTDDIVASKILACHRSSEHEPIRLVQGCLEISRENGQRQYGKDIRIRPIDALQRFEVAAPNDNLRIRQTRCRCDRRHIQVYPRSDVRWRTEALYGGVALGGRSCGY